MKKIILALTLLTSICTYASKWADVRYEQLPLTKDFVVEGTLEYKALFTKNDLLSFSLVMSKDFVGSDVSDPYYANKGFHRVQFKINDEQVCNGISFLSPADELGKGVKYLMIVQYDVYDMACPYQVQLHLGAMEENSTEVSVALVVYRTNDLDKEKVYKGILKKH